MTTYEIYWSDLTKEAQERLAGMYDENIDMSPIAIIDREEETEFDAEHSAKFKNWYKCPVCGCRWDEVWDSMCDSQCECGQKNVSPHYSEEIKED